MRHHRFILPINFTTDIIVVEEYAIVHQMGRVLKLQIGEEVVIINGKGEEAICKILEINKSRAVLAIIEKRSITPASAREVTAYLSLLKRDHFEWAIQKATEIGVTKIVPIVSQRTIKLGARLDRLARIVHEAVEQSGRLDIPKIESNTKFSDAMSAALATHDKVIFFDFCENKFVAGEITNAKKVAIFIGPEGGWEAGERQLAQKKGCLVRSLGPTILRAETAALVASYIVVNA